jgi:uncharacterized protein involved in exopolysaccharide biosynthesis
MFNSAENRPIAASLPALRGARGEPDAGFETPRFEFGVYDILNALWKRKWLVILLPLLTAGIAAFVARGMPNTYESTAQLLIDPRELRVLEKDIVPQGVSGDAATSYLESQARIITSTNMLRRMVEEQKLVEDTEFIKGPSAIDRFFGIQEAPMDNRLAAAAALAKKLTVRRGEKTFVIDISVETEDPDKSARLANAFVAAYLADQITARGDIARRTSGALTGRLAELQGRVREAEEKVEAYRRERGIVDANGRRVTDEQLSVATNQLSSARSRLADARSKLDQIESLGRSAIASSDLPEAVNSSTLGILRQQLGDAERRAANLSITLGARHPDYLSAIAVRRDAERAVGEELARIRAAARVEFQRAESNEAELSRAVETLKRATLDTSADAVRLRELQREVEASRTLYQSFLTRSLETGEQGGIDSSNTRVIAEAVAPLEKSGPNRKLLIALGGMLGGALAAGIAVLLELIGKFRAFGRASEPAILRQPNAEQPLVVMPPKAAWSVEQRPAHYAAAPLPIPASLSEPERETYTELIRIMRKIEEIEDEIRFNRNPKAA